MVIEIHDNNFESEVLNSDLPVLVDFNAGWCGPCRALKPIVEELSEEHPEFKFVSVDVDEMDELAEDNDVSSIPCLVVYKNGEEVARNVGLIPKEAIIELLENA